MQVEALFRRDCKPRRAASAFRDGWMPDGRITKLPLPDGAIPDR